MADLPRPPGVYTEIGGPCQVISELNVVVVARDGLIIWENDAMGSRKVLKYLPGHRDAKKKSKNIAKVQNPKIPYFTVF